MPSSLIIVALAAAWLVVLVPMVARKRQEVTQTGDDALTSRVVRRGRAIPDKEEIGMADTERTDEADVPERFEDFADEDVLVEEEAALADEDDYGDYAEPPRRRDGRYRPGRGGFDPEAAELAARAKYAFRQRVVLALLATLVISAVVAGVVTPLLFWLTGAAGVVLTGYLAYLRRQVRIETEIRERRMARLGGSRSQARRRQYDDLDNELDARYEREVEYEPEYRLEDDERMAPAGVERKPRPAPRAPRRNAVVVDVEDEDPAFHELDEPGHPAYRRAVGE